MVVFASSPAANRTADCAAAGDAAASSANSPGSTAGRQ
jgi:hypothetical protein